MQIQDSANMNISPAHRAHQISWAMLVNGAIS